MTIENRLKKLELITPQGQGISITAIGKPLEDAIKEYEQKHNIKVDLDDKTNNFIKVVIV